MKRRFHLLGLRAGDCVEVRSEREILASLDERGRTEGLPFMPEMLQFCGARLRVSKRADKTCDPAHIPWTMRRLKNIVHLENSRCDGAGHDGCEAGCLIFWHEAWLKRASDNLIPEAGLRNGNGNGNGRNGRLVPPLITVDSIVQASRKPAANGGTAYVCQATELRQYSKHLPGWDLRQYIRDIRSGNLFTSLSSNSRSDRALETLLAMVSVLRTLIIEAFNRMQKARHAGKYPLTEGANLRTPLEHLDLQPGEFVEVLSREEILATLDSRGTNRGLLFDGEMLRFCGGIYRVLRRVHKIVDERSGRMINMKHPCIVLEGVFCKSDYHRFCPRAIYSYWRENWLKRVEVALPEMGLESEAGACRKAR